MLTRPQGTRHCKTKALGQGRGLQGQGEGRGPTSLTGAVICLSPFVISEHVNIIKWLIVFCIDREPLKKVTYLATRPRFLAQGQSRKASALDSEAKASDCKANDNAVGFKAKAKMFLQCNCNTRIFQVRSGWVTRHCVRAGVGTDKCSENRKLTNKGK